MKTRPKDTTHARRLAAALGAALVALGLAASAGLVSAGDAPKRDLKVEETLRKETRQVQTRHSTDLEPIVKWCVDKKLKKQAGELVSTIERITPEWKTLPDLKKLVDGASDGGGDSDVKDFDRKLKYAQEAYAQQLMKLAKDCARNQLFSRAYDLVGSVLDANPDHAEARKIRGFVKVQNRWVTRFEAKLLETNVLYKDKAGVIQGWVPKKDVPHWDKGERPFGGGWVPEEEEIRKCQLNEFRAWSVESEHFDVHTNISRTAAYEFGQLLEDYYQQFFRTFIQFFDTEKGIELLFNVQPLKKKLVVLYFPSRDKYLAHVKQEHGNEKLLTESAGFYSGGGSCAHDSHFYYSDDMTEVLSTTYHETTHQLFGETKEDHSGTSVGNNWVAEGIASYVETWGKDSKGRWVPGMKRNHGRLVEAKHFLEKNPDWKLADFLALEYKEFHENNRGLHYALAEAISYFLMHYDDERYKEDFVRFIAQYYGGKAKADSLYEALVMDGVTKDRRSAVLEKQFKDFMTQMPSEPEREPRAPGGGGKGSGDDEGKKGDE